jgi:hypothetical protein
MKVKIRHIDEGTAKLFCDIQFDQVDELLGVISQAGGILYKGNYYEPSFDFVFDGNDAYVDLVLMEDD